MAKTAAKSEELEQIQLSETVAMLESLGIKVAEVQEATEVIGDGWHVLADKDLLINVPFIITDYRFTDGRFKDPETGEPRQFVILHLVTREAVETNGRLGKWILTDGSTGIMKQVGEWVTKKEIDLNADNVPALLCKGLVRSDYENDFGPSSTYYIQV